MTELPDLLLPKPAPRPPLAPAALALLGALASGQASAQDLAAYTRLAGHLDRAAQVRAGSAQAALEELDGARAAMEQLSPSLRNRQIISGLNEALRASRASLARTPAELQAQVLLARGLMRKALYDQSLTGLSAAPAGAAPKSGNSSAQLSLLAREFGLDAAGTQALRADAQAGRWPRVAWRLQREAANRSLAALRETQPRQSTASYVSLARATGWFTVIQDAGAGVKLSQFGQALTQLTSGQTQALAATLTTLRGGLTEFTRTLAAPTAAAVPAPAPKAAPAPKPAPAPAPAPGGKKASAPAPVAAEGTAGLYAALGRALAASAGGDAERARQELSGAVTLASVDGGWQDAPGFAAWDARLRAAQDRVSPRPAEVQALIGGLAGLEAEVAGGRPSAVNRLALLSSGFAGWGRVAVFAVLALLAALPLYLLNLAFGGRNAYWRAISAGLVLLLLPLLLEGGLGLLAALGDVMGVGPLRALGAWTVGGGAHLLPLWALSLLGALGLLTFGFRGLCEQFGLLGRAPAAAAQPSLEWDEEG